MPFGVHYQVMLHDGKYMLHAYTLHKLSVTQNKACFLIF